MSVLRRIARQLALADAELDLQHEPSRSCVLNLEARTHSPRPQFDVDLASYRPVFCANARFRVSCFVHLIYLLLDLSDEALAIVDWREWQQLFARLPAQHR